MQTRYPHHTVVIVEEVSFVEAEDLEEEGEDFFVTANDLDRSNLFTTKCLALRSTKHFLQVAKTQA
mgnify:CR=1 FL=1